VLSLLSLCEIVKVCDAELLRPTAAQDKGGLEAERPTTGDPLTQENSCG
jgi:hypothetical protein